MKGKAHPSVVAFRGAAARHGARCAYHHLPGFGLVVSVLDLPKGSLEPEALADPQRIYAGFTPAGCAVWRALQLEAERAARAAGGVFALFLHPSALARARARQEAPDALRQ